MQSWLLFVNYTFIVSLVCLLSGLFFCCCCFLFSFHFSSSIFVVAIVRSAVLFTSFLLPVIISMSGRERLTVTCDRGLKFGLRVCEYPRKSSLFTFRRLSVHELQSRRAFSVRRVLQRRAVHRYWYFETTMMALGRQECQLLSFVLSSTNSSVVRCVEEHVHESRFATFFELYVPIVAESTVL